MSMFLRYASVPLLSAVKITLHAQDFRVLARCAFTILPGILARQLSLAAWGKVSQATTSALLRGAR